MASAEETYARLKSGATGDTGVQFVQFQQLGALARGEVLARIWCDEAHGWKPSNEILRALRLLEFGDIDRPLEPRFPAPAAIDALRALATLVDGADEDVRLLPFRAPKLIYAATDWLHPAQEAVTRLLPAFASRRPLASALACIAVGNTEEAEMFLQALADAKPGPLFAEETRIAIAQDRYPVLVSAVFELAQPAPFGIELEPVLGDLPDWQAFAERAVASALNAARETAQGTRPYQSDKLLSLADAHSVARAMRYGLSARKPWALESFGPLLEGAAYAPDPKAKSVPSQSLSIGLGHAAVEAVQPEAILALRRLSGAIRHAGIKKKLTRAQKNVESALAARPENVLELAASGDFPLEFAKLLPKALEGLLTTQWWFEGSVWDAMMSDKALARLASQLVWEVDTNGVILLAMPDPKKSEWVLADDARELLRPAQKVRLWHPAEGREADRQSWRAFLVDGNAVQPFAQAFRETYIPPEFDLAGREVSLLAGVAVNAMPLVGLARTTGWRGRHDRLARTFGGYTFSFSAGTHIFPGAGGIGTTGPLRLEEPKATLAEVPPRILSEALRATDLLVAVGAAGVTDDLPPVIGSQSIEMRRALLSATFPGVRIDGRWLLLAEGHRFHLGTGMLFQDDKSVESAADRKPKLSLLGKDRVVAKAMLAIDQIGL